MNFRTNIRRLNVPLTALAAATLVASAQADQYSRYDSDDMDRMNTDWKTMQDEVIKATDVMDGDVTNGMNPMGDVRDLVLSPDSQTVKFILYETPYNYLTYGGGDGFIRFDNAAFQDAVWGDLEVRIDDDEDAMEKENLRLTRAQADHRMVSNIIGSELTLEDDNEREIENLLIDREDGSVTHVVIAMDEDSVFNSEPRAIPMKRIDIDERGNLSASLELSNINDMQRYAPEFLK